MKKIVVAGAEGYIGSVLSSRLHNHYEVVGIDTGYYSDVTLFSPEVPVSVLRKDIRLVDEEDLKGAWAVICLADLNDPTSQLFPSQTVSINLEGLKRFSALCKKAGVKRFLYSSSASVYGFAGDERMDELSHLNPLTPYAECKVKMEEHLSSLAGDGFSVACMRNATVYGLSPRMRFDLVINYLCGTAVANNIVELKSDGGAWRPFVHIDDLCNTFISVLGMPDEIFSGLILNVGNGDKGNYRIIDIAQMIHEITECPIIVAEQNRDRRSYKIDTAKLQSLGISCERDLPGEVSKMITFLQNANLSVDTLQTPSFQRTSRIQELLTNGLVTEDLYWRS